MKPRCVIEDCERLAQKRGYCGMHYQRSLSDGTVQRVNGDRCNLEGCETTAVTKGLCNKHYQRLRSHGDPMVLLRKPVGRAPGQKECVTCREMLPLEAYNKASKAGDGRQSMCRACTRGKASEWYATNKVKAREDAKRWNRENPEKAKDHHYQVRYGITYREYEAMLEEQHRGCAICKMASQPGKVLHVDHDHLTGKVRALLCSACNSGLGNFRDQADLMRAAAAYVEQHLQTT